MALNEFVATLRLAIEIYGELIEKGEASPSAEELTTSIRCYAEAVGELEKINPELAEVKPSDGSLYEVLGDWRTSNSASAIVIEIENEIQRLGDALYSSDEEHRVKRLLEDVLAQSDEVRISIEGEGPIGPEVFALAVDSLGEGRDDHTSDHSTDRKPEEADSYRVWYATNRKPITAGKPEDGYGNEQDQCTHHGSCLVHVPESHRIGELGSSALQRILRWTDDRLKIERIEEIGIDAFREQVDGQLASCREGQRHAVVFIHGYNNSFQEAAVRAAQIGFDLGVSGAMAFFSWPSRGRRRSYLSDTESIFASAQAITDFLVEVANLPSVEHVHVIAHSMGNRGALEAIRRIASDAERLSGRRFDAFILAAADVATEVFIRDGGALLEVGERATIYVSAKDEALSWSMFLNEHERVGFHPPICVLDGFETVAVENVDLEKMGHGYIASNRVVLTDIHTFMFDKKPAAERFGLEQRSEDGGKPFWVMRP